MSNKAGGLDARRVSLNCWIRCVSRRTRPKALIHEEQAGAREVSLKREHVPCSVDETSTIQQVMASLSAGLADNMSWTRDDSKSQVNSSRKRVRLELKSLAGCARGQG